MKKLLLVDDDVELCCELAEILREEGFSVENTSDPFDGEKMIENNNYDIILVDFKMPGLNGIDLLRKAKQKLPASARFLMTGRPFIELELNKVHLPDLVDELIMKPFEVTIFLEKLKGRK
jgi:DNA-binding response OmpR family regulator